MPSLRQLHRYLGVFFTPAIVFFAFTGALQTFDLHKGARRGEPPTYPWIARIAALHKDQQLGKPRSTAARPAAGAMESARPSAAMTPVTTNSSNSSNSNNNSASSASSASTASSTTGTAPAQASTEKKSSLPLKIFVLLLALALCASSLAGLWIAFGNPRARRAVTWTLLAGSAVPLLLLLA